MASLGEIGNMVVSMHFNSYEGYARCMDRLIADPASMAWEQKNLASRLSSWVRSNLAKGIPI